MNNKLFSYTIMPLDLQHLEEICQDIKYQCENGIASMPLFSMTLVPEGNPPADKVTILCEKFAKFKARLKEMGLKCGILVQATVGHGWILGEMFPYQTHVNFNDGVATRSVCPSDSDFLDFLYREMATIAKYKPDHVMIDDDLRTIWFKGEGCACPLHMEMFNKRAGTDLTKEELWQIVNEKTEQSKKYTDIFIECQKDSLVKAAKTIRAGFDSVNPQLPASYCCCGNNAEFAYEIASALAGEGNPVTVRINNGNYTPQGARYLSRVFHRAATQVAKLKGKVDVLLAETDTCPQNRYSVGAHGMHAHYTGSILEGVNGATQIVFQTLYARFRVLSHQNVGLCKIFRLCSPIPHGRIRSLFIQMQGLFKFQLSRTETTRIQQFQPLRAQSFVFRTERLRLFLFLLTELGGFFGRKRC